MKNYRHPVFLRTDENLDIKHNLIIRFETPTAEPPFKAKLFVYIINPEESLNLLPITIYGIGGDGKIRNCTIYVNHRSPKDLVIEGIIQARKRNYSDSIRLFNKSIEINSSYALAWKYKGEILAFYLNDFKNAVSCLDRYLELNSSDAETWNLLGFMLRYLEKYNKSIEAYDRAIKENPNYEDAWINRGIVLDYIGFTQNRGKVNQTFANQTFAEAIKAFDKAIELNKSGGSARAWYNKALALYHWSFDNRFLAMQAYDKAIDIEPRYANYSKERDWEALPIPRIYGFEPSEKYGL